VGFVVDKGTGAVILRVFRSPLPVVIPLAAPHSIIIIIIIMGWYSKPILADVASGLSLTSPARNEKRNMYSCLNTPIQAYQDTVYNYYYGCTALCWALAAFSVS
jgi:hypothetical protein